MMPKLVIWGASGHALVVLEVIQLAGQFEVVGLLDSIQPERKGSAVGGIPILGGEEVLGHLQRDGIRYLIFGFGNCRARLTLAEQVTGMGFTLATAIHPRAIISATSRIGMGTVVAAGAVINPAVTIGDNAIINTAATIDHEAVISDGAHVCPGSHLGGRVRVGRGSWIGIGSAVREGVRIGEDVMIGAGSVVVADVPDGVVAYGVPARVIRPKGNE